MATLSFGEKPIENNGEMNEDEIISNFGTLIKHSEKAKTNQNLRSVIAKLEESIKDNEKYIVKMFVLSTKTGSMINSDNAPNISLRVDTINNIFDSISDSIKNLEIPQDKIDEIFFNAGKNCGESFGINFNIFLDTYMEGLSTSEKIIEWCQFDSSVGWGKLSYDAVTKTVSICNNFQTKRNDRTNNFPKDCNFFKGYISGVLCSITGKNKKPEICCELKDLCPKTSNNKECRLSIKF